MDLGDDQLDVLLSQMSSEGFGLPFMARARDHFRDDEVPGTPEHDAALAEFKAADQEAWEANRAALRTAFREAGL